jgi:hypothetical protein
LELLEHPAQAANPMANTKIARSEIILCLRLQTAVEYFQTLPIGAGHWMVKPLRVFQELSCGLPAY